MNVSKIIACDIKEGVIKNKRYIVVPVLCLFQCLYAQLNINMYKEYHEIYRKTSLLELLEEIFHGCDPIGENPNPDIKIIIPYLWFAIFSFAVFLTFDYMHNDLTQFGIQILTRTKKRHAWWLSKCIWCYVSSLWFYILFIVSTLVFCFINGYSAFNYSNVETINILADRSVIYEFVGISEMNFLNALSIVFLPLIVICTLDMIQMLLCLFVKPMYSYLIIIGLIVVGMISDSPLAFTRLGMVTFNTTYFKTAYHEITGTWICLVINIICIIIGMLYFKRYDIIPDKDKE